MAAVSDVLPWSTCPIVPTLQCGLFRSNFALPIFFFRHSVSSSAHCFNSRSRPSQTACRLGRSHSAPQAKVGAGEGNRTLVVSLEGFCSTIELHPQTALHVRLSSPAHALPCLPSQAAPSRQMMVE